MRAVIADDSALLREGIAKILDSAGWEVAGLGGDAVELELLVAEHEPDVAIVDVRMPPTHTTEGLEAAARIREKHPQINVMVLSQHIETAYLAELLATNSRGLGYLLKDRITDVAEFLDALRRVAEGGTAIDAEVVSRLMARRRVTDRLATLSDRERVVLALMAEGRSNAAIAQRLVLSERTVETHVRNILTGLDIDATVDDHRRVLAVIAYLRGS